MGDTLFEGDKFWDEFDTYRISIFCQIFELLLWKDAHADAFDLVGHLSMDSRTSWAYEDEEVHHTVHSTL